VAGERTTRCDSLILSSFFLDGDALVGTAVAQSKCPKLMPCRSPPRSATLYLVRRPRDAAGMNSGVLASESSRKACGRMGRAFWHFPKCCRQAVQADYHHSGTRLESQLSCNLLKLGLALHCFYDTGLACWLWTRLSWIPTICSCYACKIV
jgi:hypothetical protein